MNFSFKKTVSYLLITSIVSGILTPTLQAMESSSDDFPPPLRLVVTIPSSSGQSDHNRGFPPAIELTDIISPSSNGFTRNPLDSIGNSSAQSPSSITLSASSPSRVALLPPAEDTVIDIPRHGNLPAHILGTTPDELVEILNFIKHQQFG